MTVAWWSEGDRADPRIPYVVQAHDAPARSTRPVSHPVVQSDT